jgi:Skp family chaperone for outer membrane proteins
MTIELQEHKCPSCGNLLGEIEYRKVCQKHEELLERLAKPRLEQLKNQHDKENQQLQEKHNVEMKKEVDIRVQRQLEARERMERAKAQAGFS